MTKLVLGRCWVCSAASVSLVSLATAAHYAPCLFRGLPWQPGQPQSYPGHPGGTDQQFKAQGTQTCCRWRLQHRGPAGCGWFCGPVPRKGTCAEVPAHTHEHCKWGGVREVQVGTCAFCDFLVKLGWVMWLQGSSLCPQVRKCKLPISHAKPEFSHL